MTIYCTEQEDMNCVTQLATPCMVFFMQGSTHRMFFEEEMRENSAWKTQLRHWHSEFRTGTLVTNILPAVCPLLICIECANVNNKKKMFMLSMS